MVEAITWLERKSGLGDWYVQTFCCILMILWKALWSLGFWSGGYPNLRCWNSLLLLLSWHFSPLFWAFLRLVLWLAFVKSSKHNKSGIFWFMSEFSVRRLGRKHKNPFDVFWLNVPHPVQMPVSSQYKIFFILLFPCLYILLRLTFIQQEVDTIAQYKETNGFRFIVTFCRRRWFWYQINEQLCAEKINSVIGLHRLRVNDIANNCQGCCTALGKSKTKQLQ